MTIDNNNIFYNNYEKIIFFSNIWNIITDENIVYLVILLINFQYKFLFNKFFSQLNISIKIIFLWYIFCAVILFSKRLFKKLINICKVLYFTKVICFGFIILYLQNFFLIETLIIVVSQFLFSNLAFLIYFKLVNNIEPNSLFYITNIFLLINSFFLVYCFPFNYMVIFFSIIILMFINIFITNNIVKFIFIPKNISNSIKSNINSNDINQKQIDFLDKYEYYIIDNSYLFWILNNFYYDNLRINNYFQIMIGNYEH